MVAGSTTFAVTSGATGTPGSILHDQKLVQRLSHLLSREEQKSAQLDQQYGADVQALHELTIKVADYQQAVAAKQAAIATTQSELVAASIKAYVDGASANEGLTWFEANVNAAQAEQVYEDQVLGNLNQIDATLTREHLSLEGTLARETHQEALAAQETTQVHSLSVENNLEEIQTRDTLKRVTAQLATEIITYEISVATAAAWHHDATTIESAEEAAATVGGQAAANEVAAAVAHVYAEQRQRRVTGTAAGSHQGMEAVHAAESQIGVPYVWGGETPGEGFDCSGLTQWSWGRAGIYIPRTAAEQYYSMVHVPLDKLQPGDLLFYYNLDGDNEIDHVVMYVGSGPYGDQTIIAAAYTGTNIGFQQLFTYGLVGAGRP